MQSVTRGEYTGTGAAINVSVGYVPSQIEIANITDCDEQWRWTSSMADNSAMWERTVTDNATTGNASLSKITSNGVKPFAGSATAAKGFTVGSALSESGKTFAWVAYR